MTTGEPIRDEELFSEERLAQIRSQQDTEMDWVKDIQMTESEHMFTSTGSKIEHHQEAMKKLHETGYGTPIVSHIMPTDVCNLKCSFCSVGNRNDEEQKDKYGLDLGKIETYLDTLTPLGLKAVILSGGGEPTAYRDRDGHNFRDLISTIKARELEIGLITNGTMLDTYNDVIDDSFKWVRVSLYPSEYGLNILKLDKQLPKETTLGFSLVLADNLKEDGEFRTSESESEMLEFYKPHIEKILPFIQEKGGQYLRLTPDCHVHGDSFIRLHNVAETLRTKYSDITTKDGRPITLHQHKMHGTPKNCYLGFFHPVLYANGEVFPCDSNILNDDIDRRFKSEYAVAEWDTAQTLYDKPVSSLVNTQNMCPRCVFTNNNDKLEGILVNGAKAPAGSNPNHVNFI
jgi:organic radical activating enzyme